MIYARRGPKCLGVIFEFGRYFVPLGASFAVGLFASNYAYLYCSVAFLQFMKEANVVLVFGFSALVGLQRFTRARMLVICWIILGATMAVTEEMKFVFVGFLIQAVSQLGECTKNVLGEWMMSGSDFRLDPLTYTMSMAPVAFLPLAMGTCASFDTAVLTDFQRCWPLLLANALTAVCLNVLISTFIKACSTMSFILAGIAKDIFIVTVSAIAFGDVITTQQMMGFGVCLTGITAWSSIKIKPEWWGFLADQRPKAMVAKEDEETPLFTASGRERK